MAADQHGSDSMTVRFEMTNDATTDPDQEMADLMANRAKLEAESDKLLAAHFADAIELYENRRQSVERLVSAWNQGSGVAVEPISQLDDPLIAASAEPRRRARTRLTDEEVDAMRTARAKGVSVIALAKQFDVHRGTVWAKTGSA
ncbi:MAG: hypothetical protein QM607_04415 [Microbacterium sp.]